jgi:hypothetical protein
VVGGNVALVFLGVVVDMAENTVLLDRFKLGRNIYIIVSYYLVMVWLLWSTCQ